MKTKTGNRVLIVILILTITVSTLVMITANSTTFSANASESPYMEVPQITVFTHGLADFNGASHWSNTYPTTYKETVNGKEGDYVHFSYDKESLIYKFSDANIYWAKAKNKNGVRTYGLYNIGGDNIANYGIDYYVALEYGFLKATTITDISKHIVIVFEASDGEASNAKVYNEFKYVLDDVIARVKALNPKQKWPKVNFIGHSRGGITNLQYVVNHEDPNIIHTMISIGTPYFGIAVPLGMAEFIGKSEGLTDVANLNLCHYYREQWKEKANELAHINTVAIAGQFDSIYSYEVLVSPFTRAMINLYNIFHGINPDKFIDMLVQSDFMVTTESQLGKAKNANPYNFDYEYTKKFTQFNITTNTEKRNVADEPVPHNLEIHDSQIMANILKYINSASPYTLTLDYFDQGGGAFSGTHESDYPIAHTYGIKTTLKGAIKTGYTFGGWFSDINCTGTAVTEILGTEYINNATLYAKWTAKQYSIIYKDQGGGALSGIHGIGYPTTHKYGTATALKNPTRTGYTFGGWYTNSACTGTAVSSLTAAGYTSDITLYAKWTAKQYSITYKDQGGGALSGTHENGYPTTHTYDNNTTLKNPTRTGYTFSGWYTNSACTGTAVSSLTATGYTNDITLYAKWTAKQYSITYKDQGGGVLSGTHESGYSTTHTYGAATQLDEPTRTGYTFSGWYTNSACTGTAVTSLTATGYTNDITLYAKWTAKQYSITYKDQGGGVLSGTHESGYPTVHTYGNNTTLKGASRTGYTFGGWYTNSACTGTAVTSLTATEYTNDLTLYAKWTAKQYSITYKDQGGGALSGTHESGYSTTHTYGTATALKNPTKTGYTFGGWYTNSACTGTAVSSLTAAGYTNDITLYAKWTANKYNITFDRQGGGGGTVSAKATYGADMPSAAAPSHTFFSYVFDGYYSEPDGGGVKYYNADMTSVREFDCAEDIILYAKWTLDLSDYEVYETDEDDFLAVYFLMLSPTEFVLYSPTGGTYDLEVYMRGGEEYMNVVISDLLISGDILYDFEIDHLYMIEEIVLEAEVHYLVEIYAYGGYLAVHIYGK